MIMTCFAYQVHSATRTTANTLRMTASCFQAKTAYWFLAAVRPRGKQTVERPGSNPTCLIVRASSRLLHGPMVLFLNFA